jgi:hypothetical protein
MVRKAVMTGGALIGLLAGSCTTECVEAVGLAGRLIAGEVAAALADEAGREVVVSVAESLSNLNTTAAGDDAMPVPPSVKQPVVVDEASDEVRLAASLRPQATTATTSSRTGYYPYAASGPDGSTGWYALERQGYRFYYRTTPTHDLRLGWPTNVQVLESGWEAVDATTGRVGQRWWMRHEIESENVVRGLWVFEFLPGSGKYAGTRYEGTYAYERNASVRTVVAVGGAMLFAYQGVTRESYTEYSYAFTAADGIEVGKYYFGNGPRRILFARPDWTAGSNPAGDEWTDANRRPGVYLFKTWVDGTVSWWRYDGQGEECANEPSSLRLSGDLGPITAGRSTQLAAVAYNACGDRLRRADITWTSLDPEIAEVDQTGLVTTRTGGEARIRAEAGSAVAEVSVRVRVPDVTPAQVVLSGGNSVQIGGTLDLTAAVYNRYGELLENAAVTWTTLDPAVAAVDAGRVSGVAAGNVVIRATAGSVYGDRGVTVYDPDAVASVILSCPKTAAVAGGAAVDCNAVAYNYTGQALSGTVFSWQSSSSGFAAVDSSGLVTPLAKGTTTISVSAGGQTAQTAFVVYGTGDIAYVVIESANGNTLRSHDAAFKLALTARAFNFADLEVPGVSFNWTTPSPAIANVTPLTPNSSAEAAPGGSEGSVLIQATAGSVTGSFYVVSQDNRIASIQIVTTTSCSGSASPNGLMAEDATQQLYVRAFNASARCLGFVQPTWTTPANATVSANGLLTALSAGIGLSIQAATPKGDGSGNATASFTLEIYDPAAVTGLDFPGCSGSSSVFAGNSRTCTTTARNRANTGVVGNVRWFATTGADKVSISTNNTAAPSQAFVAVPATTTTGGTVTLYAAFDCSVFPPVNLTAGTDCRLIRQYGGAFTARGTEDVNYVTVASGSGTTVQVGGSVSLIATAYNYASTPQPITGAAFNWSSLTPSVFSVDTTGMATAVTLGTANIRATVAGGSAYGQLALTAIDPAYATSVTLSVSASASFRRPGDTFTVYAWVKNSQGQIIPTAAVTWTNSSSQFDITPLTPTSALVEVLACGCSGSTTSASRSLRADPVYGNGTWASRNETIYNSVGDVQTQFAPLSGVLVGGYPAYAEGETFTVELVHARGYLNGPAATSLNLQWFDGSAADYDIDNAGQVTNLLYQSGALRSPYVTVTDLDTGDSRTFYTYDNATQAARYFYVFPAPIDMAAAVDSGTPTRQNGTIELAYRFFPDQTSFDVAATATSLVTVPTVPELDFLTEFRLRATEWDSARSRYGIRQPATGDAVSRFYTVSLGGYIKFGSSEATVRVQAMEGARLSIGGVPLVDGWANRVAGTSQTAWLTNLDINAWYRIDVDAIVENGSMSYGLDVPGLLWAASPVGSFSYSVGSQGHLVGRD